MDSKRLPAGGDRRRISRVPKEIDAKISALDDPDGTACKVHNMSAEGAVVRAKDPVPVGGIVRLDILDPDTGVGRRLTARVMWAKATAETGTEAGLKFVEWRDVTKERRRSPRRDVGAFIQYRYLESSLSGGGFLPGMLQSVSEGGLSFSSAQACLNGSLLEVKLPKTPLGPAKTIRAKVLRVQPFGGRDRWLIAAKLVN